MKLDQPPTIDIKNTEVTATRMVRGVSTDGQQFEARVDFHADLGNGPELIGEMILRNSKGGLVPLLGLLMLGGANMANELKTTIDQMIKEKLDIQIFSDIPLQFKN